MRVFKWLGIVMLSVAALVVIGVGVLFLLTNRTMARTYDVTVQPVAIPADSAALARGRHIARAVAKCVECHGDDMGGTPFIDASVFAVIPARNLTTGQGGSGRSFTDLDYVRAIRHGVRPDGRGTMVMPAEAYRYLSDEDLGAVIAWLKSLPPVDREFAEPKLGPIGRFLLLTDKVPFFPAATFDHTRADVPPAPAADTSVAYGQYLARVGGCTTCHGANLAGRPPMNGDPNAKPSANLTPGGIGEWTEADFARVLREGRGIGGRVVDSLAMPIRYTRELTDTEIGALWRYLRSVPPKQFGDVE